MVLIGGMGTIEGPVLGALVLFGLQEALSSYGASYLVIVGGLAAAAALIAPAGCGDSPPISSAGPCSRSVTGYALRAAKSCG
jgi:branched-chain amino acid transport system permease protein